MPANQINYILVYKANTQGYPGSDGNTTMPSNCSGFSNCVRFTWQQKANGGAGAFRYTDGAWSSSTISACFPGNPNSNPPTPLDRVGVYMNAKHNMMTGLFGSSITITDHAVFDFEPLPSATCNGTGNPNTGGHS
jgi:hypothetical protein